MASRYIKILFQEFEKFQNLKIPILFLFGNPEDPGRRRSGP
jgi:hypothetical protein